MPSTITAIVSDTHVGSWTALATHTWEMDTGELGADGKPVYKQIIATPAQDWIYDKWVDYWRHVWELAHAGGHRIVVLHLGDVIDGLHNGSTMQALPNLADQEAMAVQLLLPCANMADRMIIIRGTEAHAGPMHNSEARIARELGVDCVFEDILDIDGVIVDVAHHGRVGQRGWTSAAAAMATGAILDASLAGRPLPRYVFRGHNHAIDDSGEKIPGVRAIAMPSWTLRNVYGYRIASGTTSDIGGIIILPDGSLDMSRIRYFDAPGQRQIRKI